ncbi:uncharacterized protein RCC_02582 [Ramularia collo-cygni]|uniref:Nitrogen permease regulator 3 n=1 Tax=Ramularia collo-cygni TaxID=112498 RepID=A0A2D3UWV6_9PEZI|nr:uncharacterized protein RCC_02582 [Ramularia collo-cygni]CZT16747.1 uncharacterized protein RCC_02582 [Ramularia collo-cygni]
MASPSAVSGIGLVAILLMTRSRPGPRLVFHYPEEPTSSVDSDDRHDNADLSSESSDDEVRISRTPVHARTARFADISELVPSLGKLDLRSGKPTTGGEILTGKVLGHTVGDLEKMLSPGRWSDGKRFEICMDGFTFLGHPVYAPEDGNWTPKSEVKDSKPTRDASLGGGGGFLDVESFQASGSPSPKIPHHGQGRKDYDFTHMPDSFEDKSASQRFGASMESSSTNSNAATIEKMTMFQVVLVLSPEKSGDAEALYTDIIKPLSKALHHCQKQSNYLSTESQKLLAMKAKAKQKPRFTREDEQNLWRSMLEASDLAWSLAEIYSKIAAGDVASCRLNGLDMTLCTSPTATRDEELDPDSALLLLEPPETLLAELAGKPSAAPLTHFLQSYTPTKSFLKLSQTMSMPLPSLLALSRHLIFYRKAIALSAPLHWRNIYVVSPDAPVYELGKFTDQYAKLFPTLPSLPNMLKVLSGRPIRYGVLVPSRDHRGKYLEILEWLVRKGFVVQAMRYGWIQVPKSMLERRVRGGSGSEMAVSEDDGLSVSSERTAIANGGIPANRRLSEIVLERRLLGRKRGSDATAQGSVFSDVEEDLGGERKVLVKDPSAEAHLLEHLQSTFEDLENRDVLAAILPFFNGEHAFEEIAIGLGLKRSSVERVIEGLEAKGWVKSLKSI